MGNSQGAEHASQPVDFEVVVAHFNEDLSWLTPVASAATIYAKGAFFKTSLARRDELNC